VLTAAKLVNGKWQISTPYRIDTPYLITKTVATGDYIRHSYICAKFGVNPSTAGGWGYCANG